MWHCRFGNLVAKLVNNASSPSWWPCSSNWEPMLIICPDFLASSLAIQNCDLANFLKLVKKKVAQSVRLSVGQGMQSLLGHVGNFLE